MEDEKVERMTLKKHGNDDWQIHRANANDPKPNPGHKMEWEFDESAPTNVVAHFQFTRNDFVENDEDIVTKDWTSVLERPAKLKLKLRKDCPERTRVRYAVFITPDNVWATDGNPPPKVDVGP